MNHWLTMAEDVYAAPQPFGPLVVPGDGPKADDAAPAGPLARLIDRLLVGLATMLFSDASVDEHGAPRTDQWEMGDHCLGKALLSTCRGYRWLV